MEDRSLDEFILSDEFIKAWRKQLEELRQLLDLLDKFTLPVPDESEGDEEEKKEE